LNTKVAKAAKNGTEQNFFLAIFAVFCSIFGFSGLFLKKNRGCTSLKK